MNLERLSKNRPLLSVILSVITFIIVFFASSIFYSIDEQIQTSFLNQKKTGLTDNIVVVQIDEKTIKKLWRFPFKRDIYADLIEILEKEKVSTIWFDIILADKSKNDKKLQNTLKKYKNVILGAALINKVEIEKPLKIFEKEISWFWFFEIFVDNKTKHVNSFVPKWSFRNFDWNEYTNKKYNHFSIEILKNYYKNIYKKEFKTYSDKNYFYIKNSIKEIKVPFERENSNKIFVKYTHMKDMGKINRFSMIDILEKNYNDFSFENKIVIVWATAKGLKDIFLTPNWQDFWINIHANILNNFITNTHYTYFNLFYEWILIFLLIIVWTYFNLSKNSKILLVANIAIVVWFWVYFLFVSIFTNLILNNPTALIFSLILSLTGVNFIKYYIEDKNKAKLSKAISEYVSKDIANKILSWEWDLKLEWDEKRISIFFSDIAWFTSISEKFDAQKLVAFLREYLSLMSNVIMDERGFINKYEWDAIMALFWTFWYEETSTYDNCKSALEQQYRLKLLNKVFSEKYGQTLEVRMWLHTWNAIIWNIWAKWRKMEFTALWDSVNLASRLEWVNKFYGTFICASEDVYKESKQDFDFRYLDKIRVKWKNNAIKIYELLWFKWKTSDLKLSIKDKFEKALDLYYEKEFEKASNIFQELANLWDNPSSVFSRRCLQFEMKPPEENWDWVWTMKEK